MLTYDTDVKVKEWMKEIADDVIDGGGNVIDNKNFTFGKRFDSARIYDSYNLSKLNIESLHNVSDIEQKIYHYLKNEGVELYVCPSDDSEAFVCTKQGYKAIFLCPKDIEDKNETRIISLAHEVGHYLDLKFNFNFDASQFTIASMNGKELIKTETIAWENARTILKEMGFNNWDSFEKELFVSLTTYTESLRDTLNNVTNSYELILERIYRKEHGE